MEQNGFRAMRRFRQQLTTEQCAQVLSSQPRGVLAVAGDGGYPYALPLDFFYDAHSGNLWFHCARQGHKLDAIRRCDKVSFCVMDEGFRRDGEWALNIRSVIVFGRIRVVEDAARREEILRCLGRKYYPNPDDVEAEIRKDGSRALCLELVPDHVSGKLVNES